MGKRTMNVQEIISYLQDLGDELARRGFREPVRVVIFGGVFMVIEVQNRQTTQDVDIALLDFPDMTRADAPEETRCFQRAIRAVSRKRHLPQAWVNDDGSMFLKGFAPSATFSPWKTFNMLNILFPSKEVILVLKLLSFREKDLLDIEALCSILAIQTRAQAQALLNEYVDVRWQREYVVDRALDEFFG